MARLQEQAMHAGMESSTSLQFGLPGKDCKFIFGLTFVNEHHLCNHLLSFLPVQSRLPLSTLAVL